MDSRMMIVGGVAFTVGGVAGFLTARKLLEQHYQEIADLEIEDVKDYYREKYENVPNSNPDQYRKIADKYIKPDLHSLVNGEEERDEDYDAYEDEEEDEPLTLAEQQLRGTDEPYVISYESFVQPTDILDKETLFYYREDDTVCDEEDRVWENPEDILGWDWQKPLERQTTVFVRNERLQTDYEIHSILQSFGDAVGSRIENDREKKARHIARHKEAMDSFSSEQISYEEQMTKKKNPYIRPTKKQITEEIANELKDDELYSA